MKEKLNKEYILSHKKECLIYGIACILIIACISFYIITEHNDQQELERGIAITEEQDPQEDKTYTGEVIVDICGEVNEGKVVTLPAGSRIEDAINAAGGLTEQADLSQINRAEILEDGQKIYIPQKGQNTTEIDETASSGIAGDGKVDINKASAEELQTLDGIGPVTADKIVQWRTEYGSFKKLEDLMEVNGIGEKTFAGIKDKIKV